MSGRKHSPDTGKSAATAAGPYWLVVGILSALVLCAPALGWVSDNGGFLTLAVALPGVQIVASLVTVVIIAVSGRKEQDELFASLGRITLGSIIGALIGGLLIAMIAGAS